jgi:hypothetical protein
MKDSTNDSVDSGSVRRKRYQPPRIMSREVIEAMALVCRPVPPCKANAGTCPTGPSSS